MNQSEFTVPEAAGIRTRLFQKRVQSLFLSPLRQFPLGSFARSSLAELVFVIRSPPRRTEKEQLAVYATT